MSSVCVCSIFAGYYMASQCKAHVVKPARHRYSTRLSVRNHPFLVLLFGLRYLALIYPKKKLFTSCDLHGSKTIHHSLGSPSSLHIHVASGDMILFHFFLLLNHCKFFQHWLLHVGIDTHTNKRCKGFEVPWSSYYSRHCNIPLHTRVRNR